MIALVLLDEPGPYLIAWLTFRGAAAHGLDWATTGYEIALGRS